MIVRRAMDKVFPDSQSAEFHIAEYTSLHGEIRELVSEARTLERQALFAIGAVWAWLAANGGTVPRAAWFIPMLFAIGGAVRAWALRRAVENIVVYIRKIEDVLAARPNLIGWETFRRQEPPPEGFVTSGVTRSAYAYWAFLVAATIVAPLVILQFSA